VSVTYEVATPVYDGPFDLLLHLILKEEVDIHEISLLTIVEAYLAEVSKMEKFDLEVATEFLLIAATLVELKTRRLLPSRENVDLDEELALWEQRDLLLSRLLDHKTFKDVAGLFSSLMDRSALSFPRRSGPDERFAELMPDILEGVTPLRLQRAYVRSIMPKPPTSILLDHVAPIGVSVADALLELVETLPSIGRVTFRELTVAIRDRIHVVVRFLALLELFKQRRVDLEQRERFGDIVVTWIGGDNMNFDPTFDIDDYEG